MGLYRKYKVTTGLQLLLINKLHHTLSKSFGGENLSLLTGRNLWQIQDRCLDVCLWERVKVENRGDSREAWFRPGSGLDQVWIRSGSGLDQVLQF